MVAIMVGISLAVFTIFDPSEILKFESHITRIGSRKNSKIRTKRMQDLKNVRARWKGQCQRSFKTVKKYGN